MPLTEPFGRGKAVAHGPPSASMDGCPRRIEPALGFVLRPGSRSRCSSSGVRRCPALLAEAAPESAVDRPDRLDRLGQANLELQQGRRAGTSAAGRELPAARVRRVGLRPGQTGRTPAAPRLRRDVVSLVSRHGRDHLSRSTGPGAPAALHRPARRCRCPPRSVARYENWAGQRR